MSTLFEEGEGCVAAIVQDCIYMVTTQIVSSSKLGDHSDCFMLIADVLFTTFIMAGTDKIWG